MKPSYLAHIKHILHTLKQHWSQSGDNNILACGKILECALEEGLDEAFEIKSSGMVDSPRQLCLEGRDPADQVLLQVLFASWHRLTWRVPEEFKPPVVEDGRLMVASLIGPNGPLKCDKISVDIMCVHEDTTSGLSRIMGGLLQ